MHLTRCSVCFRAPPAFTVWNWIRWSLRKTTIQTSIWISSLRRPISGPRTTRLSRPIGTRYSTYTVALRYIMLITRCTLVYSLCSSAQTTEQLVTMADVVKYCTVKFKQGSHCIAWKTWKFINLENWNFMLDREFFGMISRFMLVLVL